MAANKVRGVRAAACYSVALAKNSREHNDANVLTLGAGQTDFEAAKQIVETFLAGECVEERHRKRVQLINEIEDGPIGVGAHQATLLAAIGDPRVNASQTDLERIAKRVQELLAAQGNPPIAATDAQVTAFAVADCATDRSHRVAARHDPRRHRAALPRGASEQVLLGLREPDLGFVRRATRLTARA